MNVLLIPSLYSDGCVSIRWIFILVMTVTSDGIISLLTPLHDDELMNGRRNVRRNKGNTNVTGAGINVLILITKNQ